MYALILVEGIFNNLMEALEEKSGDQGSSFGDHERLYKDISDGTKVVEQRTLCLHYDNFFFIIILSRKTSSEFKIFLYTLSKICSIKTIIMNEQLLTDCTKCIQISVLCSKINT